jgi:hypothetical protein
MLKKFKNLFKTKSHKNYEFVVLIVTIFFLIDKIIDETDHTVALLYNTIITKHEDCATYSENLLYAFEKMLRSRKYLQNDKEKINHIYSNINSVLENQEISFSLPLIYV